MNQLSKHVSIKQFLINLLHKSPLLIALIVLSFALIKMGNSPEGQASAWIASITDVLPIVSFVGVMILLLSCVPEMTVDDKEDEEPSRGLYYRIGSDGLRDLGVSKIEAR